jgi:rsbT antagonist protein RsbS
MPNETSRQPPPVSILRRGRYLMASIHVALDDGQLTKFQHDLVEQIGRDRCHGVIIDLAAMDVLDSFAAHTLRSLARMADLRGASTVIVGIKPDVAFAMARLGVHPDIAPTAFDLDDGIAVLDEFTT